MNMKDLMPWGEKGLWEDIEQSLTNMRKEMDRIMKGDWSLSGRFPEFQPRINVTENEKAIKVTAELPGIDSKDVEVTATDGMLVIKGEKRAEHEEKKEDRHIIERSYGSFRRTIPLPAGVEKDKISATFEKGVLSVEVPKGATTKETAKKIEVKSQ